ncbi:MAG: lipoyl(octanoyl) transferase LipB [Gammaproteobacteria bacterium]|nr:lipoyl(octanoyl) transferase LipB [Gammaproteobacteria bacterium]
MKHEPIVRDFGLVDYVPVWKRMARFAATAGPETREEIWLLSHNPVFTLGQAAKEEHLLAPDAVPVIQTDRGGQVTYHGPGQLVVYPLLDLRRRGMGIRQLVDLIETALIEALAGAGITAATRPGAPGVFVGEAKIAALGLRIRRGWSYHGLSLNVDMDLAPFSSINPCGFRGLEVTRVADLVSGKIGLMNRMKTLLTEASMRQLERFPPRQGRAEKEEAAHA